MLQLVEFLDVIDDPILGYTAPAVITVLHTHLATCAVDYRCIYLKKCGKMKCVLYLSPFFTLIFCSSVFQTSVSATASVVHSRVILFVQ